MKVDARQALREGDPSHALTLLQQEVRAQPADVRLRIFLFQLLAVLGRWDKALAQLELIGQVDASALPMVQTCRETIACERLRDEVFAGRKTPMLLGEPLAWTALLVEALIRDGRGEHDAAQALRAQAFDEAPASPGLATTDQGEQRFEWIADADMRLGPVVEAVINGRYCWVPFCRLAALQVEPPTDLRDCVWTAAHLWFTNGGESVAFIPTRYAGTPLDDGALALARRTEWLEAAPGLQVGQGQRLWATDTGDLALMDVRRVDLAAV